MRRLLSAALPLVVASMVAAGCQTSSAATNSRIRIVSTVAPITDIVRQVVGDQVDLVGLIPDGVDSHTFEPSPSTVKALAQADILFMDGLHLEGSTLAQAKANMAKGSKIVSLGDLTVSPDQYAYDFTFPKAQGDPNPHLWMDPTYAIRFSELIRDAMVRRDGAHAEVYVANQRAFATAVTRVDTAVRTAINTIPANHRKLLTYHDSFAYFARRYGLEVIGAVQPSDFSEPSAREITALIDQVKATDVPAVFGSEVFPSTVLRQVASATGAEYVDQLSDDVLPGAPADQNHTYVGLIVTDVRVMVTALGGDATALDPVAVGPTWRHRP
ncbi:MAG: manganese/iron transport system substrate-binding protein [Actinomycetota bacterium]|jgi:ABC-type Zn uptake system ZnuABC Zn-binding protein ZnuA|nr:manganese/iron transport system substrate-binding protein [Actinomycetota bacterium]